MAAITSTTESWNGHKFSEVESHIKGNYSVTSHTHSSVKDSYNNTTTTLAYGKAGLDYTGYTWLAGWNGYELRAVDKTQFATAGHNHDSTYSKTGHTHSYLPLSGGTVTGVTNLHKGLFVSGRTQGSGDDEGIVIGKDTNGYAGLTLGSPSGLHSTFYLDNENHAIWRYKDTNGTVTTIQHPYKNGTIALTSDLSSYSLTSHTHSYLPLTGGTLTGDLTLNTHLLVKTDKTSNIGSTNKYFNNVYQYSCHVWDNVNIGYQIGQLQADRAELTIISRTNAPADLIFGKSSTKEWQFSYRTTGEINVYRNVTNTLAFIFDGSSNFTAYGGVTALSDARHKEVVRNTDLTVEQIADMPSILFKWNDGKHDDGLHVGTLAQSWQKVLPEVVLEGSDEEKTLSFNYGVAALVSSITTARKVVDHEKEIKALKTKINVLEERISELEG